MNRLNLNELSRYLIYLFTQFGIQEMKISIILGHLSLNEIVSIYIESFDVTKEWRYFQKCVTEIRNKCRTFFIKSFTILMNF